MKLFVNRSSRRRALAVASVAVIATGVLAGCAPGADTNSDASIKVAALESPSFNDCVVAAADRYEDETGTAVEVEAIPWNAMRDKYLTGISAGTLDFDLIQLAFQWTGEFADAGVIQPVNTDMSELIPSVVAQYEFQGDPYAVPYVSAVYGAYYRTDVLEELGVDYPGDWDAMEDVAQQIKDHSTLVDAPMALAGERTQGMANFNSVYQGLSGEALESDAGEVLPLDHAAAVEALEIVEQNLTTFGLPGSLASTVGDTGASFRNGDVAFLMGFNTVPGGTLEIEEPSNEVYGKYAFAAVPGAKGDLGGWGMAVTSTTHKAEAAESFAEYLASPEIDVMCATEFARGPVRAETFEDEGVLASNPVMPAIADAISTGVKRYTGPAAGELNDIVDEHVSRYLAGEFASADAAVESMSAALASVSH